MSDIMKVLRKNMNPISFVVNKIIEYFKNDFSISSFFVAVVGYIIIFLIKEVLNLIKVKHQQKSIFNISGFWIADFDSIIYENRHIIEIYSIKQYLDNLKIKIYHYSTSRNTTSILSGQGKIRKSYVSFYYSTHKKASVSIGCEYLEIISNDVESIVLKGNYYEDYSKLTDEKRDKISKLLMNNNMIELKRINLPLKSRFKLFFLKKPYKNYSEIEKVLR